MSYHNLRLVFPLWIMSIIMACVTVNVYFPAKEVEKKAEDIVDDIRKSEPPAPKPSPSPESSLKWWYSAILGSGLAHAQKRTESPNPAVQNLKHQIRERFPKLIPLFQKGAIGEANTGFLEILDNRGMTSAEKNDLKVLVDSENRDRRALYREVAKSLNISSNQVGKVQRIFAEKWQHSASHGWWIQKRDGNWVQK